MLSVSVAMATHNGAAHLPEQLASILAQSPSVDQIVISDDASSDASLAVAERVLAGSPIRATILANDERLGYVGNFGRALGACDGDVVLLADQDDEWLPGRVASALAAFARSPALLCFGDAVIMGDEDSPTVWDRLDFTGRRRHRFAADPLAALLRGNVVMGATTGLRRGLLDVALPMPAVAFHDYWLALMAAAAGPVDQPVEQLPAPVLRYRQHGGNASGGAAAADPRARAAGRLGQGYRDRLETIEQLQARLALHGLGSRAHLRALADARDFLLHREALPTQRLRRLWPVGRHTLRGDYRRYSRGVLNAAYDLIRAPQA